jgi:hypothetical protein
MATVSLLTAVVVLIIFKYTSRQSRVRRKRNRLLARVLEMLLFKDDVVVNLGAFGRVLAANAAYLAELVPPLCATLVPVALVLAQLSEWYGSRPFVPGERAVVTVGFDDAFPVMEHGASLRASDDLQIETGGVRVPERNEISWRVLADGEREWVEVRAGESAERKSVTVGTAFARVSRRRGSSRLSDQLAHPSERPLPRGGPIAFIEVSYASSDLFLGRLPVHWLLVFLVLTLLFGLVLKWPMGVEI